MSDVVFLLAKVTFKVLMILHLLGVAIALPLPSYLLCQLATKMMFLSLIIDRFISIAFPLDYIRVMTAKAVKIIISRLNYKRCV